MTGFDALTFVMQTHLGTTRELDWASVPDGMVLPSNFASTESLFADIRISRHQIPAVMTVQQDRTRGTSLLTTGYLNFHDGIADTSFFMGSDDSDERARSTCRTMLSFAVLSALLRRRAWREAMFLLVAVPCFSGVVTTFAEDPFVRHMDNVGPMPEWPDLTRLHRAVSVNFPIAHEFAHSLGQDGLLSNVADVDCQAALGDEWASYARGGSNHGQRDQILRELCADNFASAGIDRWLKSQKLLVPVLKRGEEPPESPSTHTLDALVTCLQSAWLLSAADAVAAAIVSRDLDYMQSQLERAGLAHTMRARNLVNHYRDAIGETELSTQIAIIDRFIRLGEDTLNAFLIFVMDRREMFFGSGMASFQWLEQLTMTSQFFSDSPVAAAGWSLWTGIIELDADDIQGKGQMVILETMGHLCMSPLGKDWRKAGMMIRDIAFSVATLNDSDGQVVLRETAYREARAAKSRSDG